MQAGGRLQPRAAMGVAGEPEAAAAEEGRQIAVVKSDRGARCWTRHCEPPMRELNAGVHGFAACARAKPRVNGEVFTLTGAF